MSDNKIIDEAIKSIIKFKPHPILIKLNVDGFVTSSSSSVEMVGLENITPFLKLCEV